MRRYNCFTTVQARDHSAHRDAVQPEGGPSRSKNCTISQKNPASRSAAPTKPNATDGVEKSQVHAGPGRRRLRRPDHQRHKFGFFVELTDLFVEGLVPLDSLADDRYTYHENTREIIGLRSRKIYRLGQRIRVLVDRIDPVEKKIQFAVLEEKPAPKRKKR